MTFASIAAELGVDEAVVRRVLKRALAKLLVGALEHDLDPEIFSTEVLTILQGGVRFSDVSSESADRGPRVVSSLSSGSSGERRARLPRRFPEGR